MRQPYAYDPVRIVRTVIRDSGDQAINQVLYQGIGRVVVRMRAKVLGDFRLQNGDSSGQKTRTSRVARGLGGILEDIFGDLLE